MIKLGQLAQSATSKKFPDNWIAIAKMTHLNYEYTEKFKQIIIYLDDSNDITIDKNNNIICSAPLPSEVITSIIIESVKAVKNKNKMGDISNV